MHQFDILHFFPYNKMTYKMQEKASKISAIAFDQLLFAKT